MNFAFYIASSIYVPGEASLMEDFDVGEIVATLGLSLFTLSVAFTPITSPQPPQLTQTPRGYALGPMLWSPLSEQPRLGRNNIYFWTFLAFTLLQLPCGYAPNIAVFLVFRFLAGFVGSPALATGGATIADMYDPARTAYGLCIWGSFGICGPVFGPILGGFAAEARGWRWTIWVVAWMASAVVVLLFFCMPESSATTILYYRAKRLRASTGRADMKSQSEIDAATTTAGTSKTNAATSQLRMLGAAFILTFTEPIVFALDLYTALLYGILFLWFESFPFVFGGIYHFTLGQQGLVFLGIFVGGVVTLPLFLLWIRYRIVPRFTQPEFVPEMVLPPTFFGSAALPVCLFFYGWSARESVHWIVPIIGSAFFTVSIITLFNPVLNYLGIAYPKQSASIFAGNALFRASFGAVFPLFVSTDLTYQVTVWKLTASTEGQTALSQTRGRTR